MLAEFWPFKITDTSAAPGVTKLDTAGGDTIRMAVPLTGIASAVRDVEPALVVKENVTAPLMGALVGRFTPDSNTVVPVYTGAKER